MGVSVVIPTCNKWPRLKLTLASIEMTNITVPFEVIIVNDGSTEEVLKELSKYKASCPYDITIIHNDTTLGRSRARNIGAGVSKYTKILFLDDDCLVSPSTIQSHSYVPNEVVGHGVIFNIPYVKFFYDPSLGQFYSDIKIKRGESSALSLFRISEDQIRHDFNHFQRTCKKRNALEKLADYVLVSGKHRDLSWVGCAGANLSVSKKLWEKYPFDESFGLLWGAEDLDFGIRIQDAGIRISLVPSAEVFHMDHVRKNFRSDLTRSFELLSLKHPLHKDIELIRRYLLREIDKERVLSHCSNLN